MKKIALFALLLATAAAAYAVTPPTLGVWYNCDYTNYSGAAADPGISRWDIRPGSTTTLIFTYETFSIDHANPPHTDTYKAAWAWKADLPYGVSQWEFTFNPSGPQCKNTYVYPGGYTIYFDNCTDGHSRVCWR